MDDLQLVHLERAPSTEIAMMIVNYLREAGIPSYVDSVNLVDEYAAFQKLAGFMAVDIEVPADRLEEARDVIHHLREASGEMKAEDGQDDGG